ncbi:transposase [Accumulibacter sp.]|uniref:transposase n=1 Tax=Accumulibacter sp. TaxID=2053492 RepID=UPI003857C642
MKRVNRSDPPEFRKAAVQRVVDGGRSVPAVARSLEMSAKTLATGLRGRVEAGHRPQCRREGRCAKWKRN